MSYIRKFYHQRYRYKSVREGDKVRSIYLGKVGAGQIMGAKLDPRTNKAIAQDMYRDAKTITTNSYEWIRDPGGIDLLGWDTTHILAERTISKQSEDDIIGSLKNTLEIKDITIRTKKMSSIVEKLIRKNKVKDTTYRNLTDVVGVRITLPSIQDIYLKADILRKKYHILEEIDYIRNPKEGYRSLHFTIEYKGQIVEVQFRTPRQTRWADYAHEIFYKNTKQTMSVLGDDEYHKAQKWLIAMGDHLARLDIGQTSIAPTQPEPTQKLKRQVPKYAKEHLVDEWMLRND